MRQVKVDGQWIKFMSWLNVEATPGVYYEVTTMFQPAVNNTRAQTATNVPQYRSTWTSPSPNVACKTAAVV